MIREEILRNSKELVNQIYAKMSIVESCDILVNKIIDLDVVFNDVDNKQIVVLNEILNAEQLVNIRGNIINKIHDNANEAQLYLERLNRKPATINQEFEKAVKEMEEQNSKVKEAVKTLEEIPKQELTTELVVSLYHEQGMTLDEVAKELGTNRSALHRFITQNNLKKPYKKEQALFKEQKKPR